VTGGGNFDLVDAGLTTLIGSVNAGAGSVALGGAVDNTGGYTLTADTLTLNGAGNVGRARG